MTPRTILPTLPAFLDGACSSVSSASAPQSRQAVSLLSEVIEAISRNSLCPSASSPFALSTSSGLEIHIHVMSPPALPDSKLSRQSRRRFGGHGTESRSHWGAWV